MSKFTALVLAAAASLTMATAASAEGLSVRAKVQVGKSNNFKLNQNADRNIAAVRQAGGDNKLAVKQTGKISNKADLKQFDR